MIVNNSVTCRQRLLSKISVDDLDPRRSGKFEALVRNGDILPLVAEAVLGYRFISLFKLDADNVVSPA